MATVYENVILAEATLVELWPLGGKSTVGLKQGWTLTYTGCGNGSPGLITADPISNVTFNGTSDFAKPATTGAAMPSGNGAWSVETWMIDLDASVGRDMIGWGAAVALQDVVMQIDNTGFLVLNGDTNFHAFGSGGFGDGKVHFCSLTYDGTTVLALADGAQLSGSFAATAYTVPGSSTPNIGVWSNWWDGSLAEIAIYNAKLSLAQHQAHYAAGLASGSFYKFMTNRLRNPLNIH